MSITAWALLLAFLAGAYAGTRLPRRRRRGRHRRDSRSYRDYRDRRD